MPDQILQTAKTMSQAVAPVFLISGVGVLLSNMTHRYGRVIDRVRKILADNAHRNPNEISEHIFKELRGLYGRAKMLRLTIILATVSIFCVSTTVCLLFAHMMFNVHFPLAPEIFFLASLVSLLIALALFIEDFAISLKILKVEINGVLQKDIISSDEAP